MARKPKGSIDPTARSVTKVGALLTPEQLAASGTEHAEQTAVMQWSVLNGQHFPNLDLLHAVPNGGDRKMSVAASLKAEGVKRGVPDLVLPVPMGAYHGLYIEMKVPGRETQKDGGRSPEQVKWHQRLRALGYAVATAYGWQAACWVIFTYYTGGLGMPVDGDAVKATPMAAPPVVG